MKALLSQVQEIFASEQFLAEPKELYAPIDYTLRLGGKRIRPLLLLAANELFDGDPSQVRDAALGIETFHNFTLLHDDLMDKSPLRRGMPTVYRKWDENTAILSGDTMFALAWRYFLRQPHARLQEILTCFNETAIQVCEGQQYDMNFEHCDHTTMAEYMDMIRLKTAVLLAGALKIGALYANAPDRDTELLYRFGIHLGLAFQLQDDLLDSFGDVAVFGKKTGQDIRDNKKTFLFLKAIEIGSPTQQQQLQRLFSTTPEQDDDKVSEVLGLYKILGIRQATEAAIMSEYTQAREALGLVQVDERKKSSLWQLTDTLIKRDK